MLRHVYALTAAGLAIIYLFPYINKTLPSPLVCIVVLTVISMWLHLDVRTVGDMGKLPDSLPVFLIPAIPLDPDTLMIILPYSAGLAVVGLLESMMTATIVDDMTNTPSDKNRECKAQGIANICTAFIGGMAGCAMIGQSVINVKSGGRGRLSAGRRRCAALPYHLPAAVGSANTDGSTGCGDGYGRHWHLLTALHYGSASAPSFDQRGDAGDGSSGGGNA